MPTILSHTIGPIGYGLMGLTWSPEPPSKEQSFAAMHASLHSVSPPANFWNGGEIYGPPTRHSAHLLAEYFDKYPDDASKVVLSVKGGTKPGSLVPDGSPTNVRRSVRDFAAILGPRKKIDIFQCARVDPRTPIEDTIAALAELVKAGEIGGIGLSEVSASTIRRAHAVHPVAAVEVELSLWSTDILRNGVARTCAELGIPVMAYSPLARGALIKGFDPEQLHPEDQRAGMPKYERKGGVLENNMRITQGVERLAGRKGCTNAQVAIAWCRAVGEREGMPVIVPIPGASREARVRENCEAAAVELSKEEMEEIDGILRDVNVIGARYGGFAAGLMEG